MTLGKLGAAVAIPLLLSACTDRDRLTFITSAEVGIGVDGALQTSVVGYNRQELIIAPQDDDGSVTATYASIEKNRALLNPQIRQVFAVGQAAEVIVGGKPTSRLEISGRGPGNKPPLVFGTSTNVGLRISASQSPGPEFNLGYKRKEFSSLRVAPGNRTGSLYGSLRVSSGKEEATDIGINPLFEVHQIFATGKAATLAASVASNEIKTKIQKEVKTPLCNADQMISTNEESCVAKPSVIPPAQKSDVPGASN